MRGRYAAGEEGGEEGTKPKAFVSLNWVLEEQPLDLETQLAWGFLDYLLLGTSAAPLRRALNDSGLGEALIGGGLMDELRQPVFSVGLKGVAPPDAPQVGPGPALRGRAPWLGSAAWPGGAPRAGWGLGPCASP